MAPAPRSYKPYLSLTGTSMAAPVVAGAVALMLEANPALTPNAVKAILQYTAQADANESALAQGAGLLNARGALRLARFFARPQDGLGEPLRHDRGRVDSLGAASHLGQLPRHRRRAAAGQQRLGGHGGVGRQPHRRGPARGVGRRQSRQRGVG